MDKRMMSISPAPDCPLSGAPMRETGRVFMRRPHPGAVQSAALAHAVEMNGTGLETAERASAAAAPFAIAGHAARRGALLEELARTIGTEGANRLVAAFGGARLYIPHFPEPGDVLSQAVGHATALALANVYGGDRIDVPNPTPRRERILRMRAHGASVDSIARALGCTRRRVFQVLAEVRAPQRAR